MGNKSRSKSTIFDENTRLIRRMGRLYDLLMKDYRLKEGLNACINCGTCTAICPAAEFYRYDPRKIVDIVQSKDDDEIEKLLKSDTIWYCGECMSKELYDSLFARTLRGS